MVLPQRLLVVETIEEGIVAGRPEPRFDIEPVLDPLVGALFAAVFAGRRLWPGCPEAIIDALRPALAVPRPERW